MKKLPKDLYFTRDHEWIRFDENGTAEIGITDHAQKALGDIVYVEFPAIQDVFQNGEEFGTVESVKTVSSLLMPVSGEVIEINEKVSDRPELVNEEPYDEGWLIRIAPQNGEQKGELLDEEMYAEFLSEL